MKWQVSPVIPQLGSKDIHLWYVNLEQPAWLLKELRLQLTSEEIERTERFKFAADRRRFLVSRSSLRLLLSQYTAPPLVFLYGERGKPYLAENPVCFNLSHSGERMLCAVTATQEVGVDIECRREVKDADRIAERFFSREESSLFQSLPPEMKSVAFFNCWTRKEAYIKACGEGLFRSLSDFAVSFIPGEKPRLYVYSETWTLRAFHPEPGYTAALAIKEENWNLSFWQFSPERFVR